MRVLQVRLPFVDRGSRVECANGCGRTFRRSAGWRAHGAAYCSPECAADDWTRPQW